MTNKKTEVVSLKVTEEEKTLLKQKAEEANTTVSRLLHKIIFSNINVSAYNE